ncbi:hypothetical protein [Halopiger aswanensis]|uniref:hypothetical protein n=1 Tax=Halopiger aswanensis TaxID=148449 RepID=UPI0011C37C8E|nr:hypothetical protein [Halopiger aswanensis]
MIGKRRSDHILLVGIPVIGVLVLGMIFLNYGGWLGDQFATLVISGVSAFASAALAVATYTTVLQNRRTVEELQKDREKPLAEDKLRQLIVPFIDEIDDKVETIEEGDDSWVRVRNAYGNHVGISPYQAPSS